ncbi:MAG: MG2 domain-containing protein, partial [Myxococcota bacterium]
MVRCLFICASCAAVVTSSLGCGNDEPPPERFLSELAQVNESNLRAALVGNDIEILLPLERRSGGVLQADLIIELMDGAADEPTVLVSETVSVQQDSLLEEHRVVLPGAGEGVERIETALQLINWRVRLDGDDLYGRRSLYAALGSLEVQLRGPTEIGEGGTSPLRVIVRQPETSEPVTGASVTAVLVEGSGDDEVVHPLFEGATDARGELLRQIGLPAGVASGTVRVTVADDRAQVWANHNLQLRRDDRLYLSTDKTIYKPGQEIQLRLLALAGADRMPVANQEVVFEAKDGRGNKVFRRRTNTDEFGVASIAVPTDVRVNEGEWRFSAEVDGRRTELAIPVERYNLPKMRIDVTADREFALPGDQVSGELRAGYLFGEPVINGSVRLQATTLDGRLVGEASGSTDATGAFSFSFEVPEALRSEALEERGDTLSITATVVDTADQREAGGTQLPLAAAPLRLNLLPELGRFELGGENLAYLLVTDPLGRPLVADVTLSGAATDVLATNAEGIAELRVSPAADAVLEVAAVDGAGRSHARNFSLMGSESELQVVTDRGTYAEGDRAELRVFAAADVSRVYVDVYRGAANVLSTEVNLTDGEGTVALPIREELGGLLVVDAMALTDDGETLRSSRAMLVEQDSGIQVAVSSAAGTYRPGEEATLEVAVTDPAGAPQIASVGLTVVDEAAFALGGEPQVQIGQVFVFDTQVLPAGL